MRFLKQRREVHAVTVEPRTHRLTVIRWLYIFCVSVLAIWLVDFSFSGLLYLHSEGLVVGEPGVIAAEFPVTVRDLPMHQGEIVKKGQVAAIVSSQNVTEAIARLTSDIAAREARRAELRIRSAIVGGLLSLAQNRQKLATSARKQLETLLSHGDLPLNQRTAAVELEFHSYQDLESLKAEKPVLEEELHTLNAALADAESAIGDLRKLYDDGRLRAPIGGVVSRVIANTGSVVRAGEPIAELYSTDRFVQAYVPTGTLYSVAVGEEVNIRMGLQTARGIITSVTPVAAPLPKEFQRSFTPVDTQQVIRVEFAPGTVPPPLLTKVSLSSVETLPGSIEQVWKGLQSWLWLMIPG
jgi:multidrug resistance efflux pump